ncbi:BON domain-containing protein [Paraburkholderia hospita]|uniref:BON domain-containing protein n=1 Tax=Paraburkholderia hospita TaxID=169430 RepID=UPI001FC7EFE9|nr:BON domain-containing protein [Paraburkholderia hospita]
MDERLRTGCRRGKWRRRRRSVGECTYGHDDRGGGPKAGEGCSLRAWQDEASDQQRYQVHAAAGVVTLSGSVPNRTVLDRAAEAAQGVPGVTAVRNNLTIENR